MNRNFMTMTAAMMMVTSACVGPEKAAQAEGPIIGKQEITVKEGRMTPETLWAMGDVSEVLLFRLTANVLLILYLITV